MKGIARILEAIIASLIILTSLSFFLSAPVQQSGWVMALEETRAQDALAAVYETGDLMTYVRNNDDAALRSAIENTLPFSTDFSMEVSGVPNPIIFLGCVCSDTSGIENMIEPQPFIYKGHEIEIRVEQVMVLDPRESNILFFTDFNELNNNYTNFNTKNIIDRFLETGGSLFLMDNLGVGDMGSEVITDIFNLTWNGAAPTNPGRFDGPDNETRFTYNTAKYYQNTTGIPAATETFSNFDITSSIDIDERTVIVDNSNQMSFVKYNKNMINGNGRAVWFNDMTGSSQETDDLMRAAIMWASGERYKMDGDVTKTPPLTSRQANILLYDLDPYEFRLTTWNIF